MNLDPSSAYRRRACIPEPIRQVGLNNPCVQRLIDEYSVGNIVTWEEALSQMVIHLAKDWNDEARRAYQLIIKQNPCIRS